MVRKGIKISIAILVTTVFVMVTGCTVDGLTGQIGAVQGVVKDQSGNPLVSSLVTVQGSSYSSLTNVDGRYLLNLPVGSYVLAASRDGFTSTSKQINVEENNSSPTNADFVMTGGTNNGPSLYVSLEANDRIYRTGDAINVKLNVVNRGDVAIKIGGEDAPWEIIAHSEEGWRLWKSAGNVGDKYELKPGETKSFETSWNWYDHPINRPVVVMLEGHVNPNVHIILPSDNDNGNADNNTNSNEEGTTNGGTATNSANMDASTPYIAGYVTVPLFIRLMPEGYAEPIGNPNNPPIEPYPMPMPGDPSGRYDIGQCYVPGADGIEPWVYSEEEGEDVIRPNCWRFTRYRRFYAK